MAPLRVQASVHTWPRTAGPCVSVSACEGLACEGLAWEGLACVRVSLRQLSLPRRKACEGLACEGSECNKSYAYMPEWCWGRFGVSQAGTVFTHGLLGGGKQPPNTNTKTPSRRPPGGGDETQQLCWAHLRFTSANRNQLTNLGETMSEQQYIKWLCGTFLFGLRGGFGGGGTGSLGRQM
jgi:hypothetical protein